MTLDTTQRVKKMAIIGTKRECFKLYQLKWKVVAIVGTK